MTVVRLSSGRLVIHSPIQFSEALRQSILDLGTPAWFVAPSRFHDLYWPEWFRSFPNARFAAVPGLTSEHPQLPFTDEVSGRSDFWDGELRAFPVRGMPRLNEHAFLHYPSRTLILADLIFNLDASPQNVVGKLFLRLNSIYRRAGISRIFRAFIKDRIAFRESMQDLLALPFDRIVIGHGKNLGGPAELDSILRRADLLPP